MVKPVLSWTWTTLNRLFFFLTHLSLLHWWGHFSPGLPWEIKRDLKRILVFECRCNERLRAKTEGSTRLGYTGLSWGTGTPKDRDDVKRREVWGTSKEIWNHKKKIKKPRVCLFSSEYQRTRVEGWGCHARTMMNKIWWISNINSYSWNSTNTSKKGLFIEFIINRENENSRGFSIWFSDSKNWEISTRATVNSKTFWIS